MQINLLEYICTKNYRAWFDNVIAKIKWCSFSTHGVDSINAAHIIKIFLELQEHRGLCPEFFPIKVNDSNGGVSLTGRHGKFAFFD